MPSDAESLHLTDTEESSPELAASESSECSLDDEVRPSWAKPSPRPPAKAEPKPKAPSRKRKAEPDAGATPKKPKAEPKPKAPARKRKPADSAAPRPKRQKALTEDQKREKKALERVASKCRAGFDEDYDAGEYRPGTSVAAAGYVKEFYRDSSIVPRDTGVTAVLGIDIGWRNGGYCRLDLDANVFAEWAWGDLFPEPDSTAMDILEVPRRFVKYVREHPDMFAPPVWAIERQPDNQPSNIAVQHAVMAVGEMMGKTVIVVSPRDIKAIFCRHFVNMGEYDKNKATAMDIVGGLISPEEASQRDACRFHQKRMNRVHRKRYKCESVGGHSPTWDDMADAALIALAVGSMFSGRDLIKERAHAAGKKTLQDDGDALIEARFGDIL